MKIRSLVSALVLGTVLLLPSVSAQNDRTSVPAGAQPSSTALAACVPALSPATDSKIAAYTLPPDRYKKAHDLGRIRFRLALLGFVYGLAVLWLILRWKLAALYRNWAEQSSVRPILQSLTFSPLLLLTIAGFTLPLDIYGEVVEKDYGISIQGWGSWSWDWAKAQMIAVVVGTVMIWLLYFAIRRSPKGWWFYFWLLALPLGVFLLFIGPWVIDPMFHKFEPLRQKDPGLAASLERLVQHAGQDIPAERMFWMGAGEKTTDLNAYVTGIGASKRIVVWDTTIARMNTPQIVFVAGHEMGHYALLHIPKGLAFFAALSLLLFYLAYRAIGGVWGRWGAGWGVRGLEDWASLPALLLLLSVFSFVASPVISAFSRHFEHQADRYGLEVTHGLTPCFGQVAAQSFQILGEVSLSDPDPNPLEVFLYYSHPTIADRVQFSLTYNPWAIGGEGEFVK